MCNVICVVSTLWQFTFFICIISYSSLCQVNLHIFFHVCIVWCRIWFRYFPVSVDLKASGHADKPIIVDRSPPTAGDVYDGDQLKKDIAFQSSSSQYCTNWNGFEDPDSGLSKFPEVIFCTGLCSFTCYLKQIALYAYKHISYLPANHFEHP